MSAPNPGGLPQNGLPASAKIVWGIAADGTCYPLRVDATGALTEGAPSLQTTNDLTGVRVNQTASGDTTVVAGTALQSVRVYRMKLSVAGATVIQIKDGAGTVLEVFNFAGNGGAVVLDFSTRPWYTTAAANGLVINSSNAVQVDGRVEYVKS
jgi:hypothetical protein